MNVYDAMAADFDRRRPLPDGVVDAIRGMVLGAVRLPRPRILDLGAGSGRIGRTFVHEGDDYVGVDLSFGMVRSFARQVDASRLVQADGGCLPFHDATFDAVLLVQVLSGAKRWRPLLTEAVRVLRPGGVVAVGRVIAPEDGVGARMKTRLAAILDGMDIHPYRDKPRDEALAWLARHMPDPTMATVASWRVERRPAAFLERHATGARFSVLPEPVRQEAMRRLADWAVETFGSLDTAAPEGHRFDLILHRCHQGTTP